MTVATVRFAATLTHGIDAVGDDDVTRDDVTARDTRRHTTTSWMTFLSGRACASVRGDVAGRSAATLRDAGLRL